LQLLLSLVFRKSLKLHEFGKALSFSLHDIAECMASEMHQSSMNMMKYLAPLKEVIFAGPQMSLCTRPKISLALVAPSFGNDSLCYFPNTQPWKNGNFASTSKDKPSTRFLCARSFKSFAPR
jgi:hypothetical protein